MSHFETRPGGENATRSNERPKARTRKEALLAEARAEGAEVVEERDGRLTIKRKRKAKKT